jgi:phage terminase small subunit
MRSTYTTYDAPEFGGEATPRRLRPSARLKGRERALFTETVADCAMGHFRKSDRPLLERYCEACALAEQAAAKLAELGVVVDGKLSPWFPAHASACKTANNLALRLRLSPQSRSPRAPKTLPAPQSYYDVMDLTEDSDDGGDGVDGERH